MLFRNNEWPNGPNKIILGRSMLDKGDHLVGPCDCVVDGQVVAVLTQKMPHCLKGSSLVGLLEGVRSRDTRHQNDGEHNNVFFAKAKEVSRPR